VAASTLLIAGVLDDFRIGSHESNAHAQAGGLPENQQQIELAPEHVPGLWPDEQYAMGFDERQTISDRNGVVKRFQVNDMRFYRHDVPDYPACRGDLQPAARELMLRTERLRDQVGGVL